MGWLWRGAPCWRMGGRRTALAAAALAAAVSVAAAGCSGPAPLSARDQHWQQDTAYLARELPVLRAGGLGPVSRAAWQAAAARLEAGVPKLSDGQLEVGLARLVAMLRDGQLPATAAEMSPASSRLAAR